jgi:uncharacterized protein YbbK (DUF523 family)/uncharacterized protein YbgA (DUF1722 family)
VSAPLRLGISSCLLGDRVRWDGSHERRDFLADVLGPAVEWVRACPELEAGLGVPREPIAFVRTPVGLALLGARSREDVGPRVATASVRILDGAANGRLDGWVLKARSPSCGPDGARVYATPEDLFSDRAFERAARGAFATALLTRWPLLPVADETALDDRAGQETFVELCYAMRRVRAVLEAGATAAALADLHERHELQALTRSAEARRGLARSAGGAGDAREAAATWAAAFRGAMARPPPPGRVVGVLRRVANRLRGRLAPADDAEAERSIAAFAAGTAELDDVRDGLREAAARAGDALLARQTFLHPDAGELALRRAIRGPH